MKGKLAVTVAGVKRELGPEMSLAFLPPGTLHSLCNEGTEEVQCEVEYRTTGPEERGVAEGRQRARAQREARPEAARSAAFIGEVDIYIEGPPIWLQKVLFSGAAPAFDCVRSQAPHARDRARDVRRVRVVSVHYRFGGRLGTTQVEGVAGGAVGDGAAVEAEADAAAGATMPSCVQPALLPASHASNTNAACVGSAGMSPPPLQMWPATRQPCAYPPSHA